jgi:hypothetical protein
MESSIIGDLLRDWKYELESDLREFQSQVSKVISWDNQLRCNWKTWNEILSSYENILSNDNELKRMCDTIEEYQNELDANMNHLEDAVKKEKESPHTDFVQEDTDRYLVYQEAEIIIENLVMMEEKLDYIFDKFRSAKETNGNQKSQNPVDRILAVMNQHIDQLNVLQKNAQDLDNYVKMIV